MRLPPPSAHYSHRVRFGRYVGRRLRRAHKDDMAADAEAQTRAVRDAGRAREDAEEPVQEALADRDAADDGLDLAAKEARARLGGRGARAEKEAPYTHVFPRGATYYTAAPLDQEEKRYGELVARLEEHLPESDPVRIEAVPAVRRGLEAFRSANQALDAAYAGEAIADSRLDRATEVWNRLMEKIYGALVSELGRAEAEKFFPRTRSRRDADAGEEDEPAAGR